MAADRHGSLAAFQRLLDHASSDADELAPVTFTEALVGGAHADLLRRCAIPHEFNAEVLRVLDPSLSREEAVDVYNRFMELSIIQVGSDVLSMHERWRKPLFKWWLHPDNGAEFAEVSRRLAAYFLAAARPDDAGAEIKPGLRKHLYHLLGADTPAGFALFESLCRRARHQWQFTECAALIKLAGDYVPVLPEDLKAALAYHDGKLATDYRDWARAETLFRGIAEAPSAADGLRAMALTRLGHALREQGRVTEAIETLARAQTAASPAGAGQVGWRVLLELGEAYRDANRLDEAEKTLLAALEAARAPVEQSDCAAIHSSLGTVYLKRHEPRLAIRAFEAGLEQLERQGDVYRTGQLQNNLAVAYLEQLDWPAAEGAFLKSLELKRRAGDLPGQGLAWQNLSRAQEPQGKLAESLASVSAAIDIFTRLNDSRSAGTARRSLGKYLRNRGKREDARAQFVAAAALFDASGDSAAAADARADLAALQKDRLPWWAWVAVMLIPGIIVALILLVAWIEKDA